MKQIQIKCKGSFALPYDQIGSIQGNLKELTKENYERLRNEIRDTGFAFPVNVTKHPEKGWVTQDGWHRVLVVKTMVEKEGFECPPLPCAEIKWESEEMAGRRILQGSSQYAHMTPEGLHEFIEMNDFDFESIDTNFDIPHVDFEEFKDEFYEEQTSGLTDEDEIPEKVEPKTKLGDLYQLGEHRLLCGDSTDKATVDRLMGGEKADMVFTSPPYNIGDNDFGRGIKGKKYLNDSDNKSDYQSFLQNFINIWLEKASFIWVNIQLLSNNTRDVISWLFTNKEFLKDIVCWIKSNPPPSLNNNVMNHGHEQIFIFSKDANGRVTGNFSKGSITNTYQSAVGGDTSLSGIHHATFSVDFAETFIKSNKGSVVDPFGGSGSTLIACEKTKRKCFMSEIDSHYVDVIVNRWMKFTGKMAYLIETKEGKLREPVPYANIDLFREGNI